MAEDTPPQKSFQSLMQAAVGAEITLDIRLKGGNAIALPYSYLLSIHYNAQGKITLTWAHATVTIEGRNLKPIYDGMLTHNVSFIHEGDAYFDEGEDSDTFITTITIEEAE